MDEEWKKEVKMLAIRLTSTFLKVDRMCGGSAAYLGHAWQAGDSCCSGAIVAGSIVSDLTGNDGSGHGGCLLFLDETEE